MNSIGALFSLVSSVSLVRPANVNPTRPTIISPKCNRKRCQMFWGEFDSHSILLSATNLVDWKTFESIIHMTWHIIQYRMSHAWNAGSFPPQKQMWNGSCGIVLKGNLMLYLSQLLFILFLFLYFFYSSANGSWWTLRATNNLICKNWIWLSIKSWPLPPCGRLNIFHWQAFPQAAGWKSGWKATEAAKAINRAPSWRRSEGTFQKGPQKDGGGHKST